MIKGFWRGKRVPTYSRSCIRHILAYLFCVCTRESYNNGRLSSFAYNQIHLPEVQGIASLTTVCGLYNLWIFPEFTVLSMSVFILMPLIYDIKQCLNVTNLAVRNHWDFRRTLWSGHGGESGVRVKYWGPQSSVWTFQPVIAAMTRQRSIPRNRPR